MVRLAGIAGGILVGFIMQEEGRDVGLLAAMILVVALTFANLGLALREAKRPGHLIRSIDEAFLTGDVSEVSRVVKEARAAAQGRPLPRTIWRYVLVCLLLNSATVVLVAAITYLVKSILG